MTKSLLKVAAIHLIAAVLGLAFWFVIAGATLATIILLPYSDRLRRIVGRAIGWPNEITFAARKKLSATDYPFILIRSITAIIMVLAGCLIWLREGFWGQSILFWFFRP